MHTYIHSGLAVKPNNNDKNNDKNNNRDAIFGMAKAASGDDKEQIRRKITMVNTSLLLVHCRMQADI
jgi:hypothetical protein